MTQEDKDLLLADICARLPYGVKCQFEDTIRLIDGKGKPFYDSTLSARHLDLFINHENFYIKPYLRPIEDMTEEEKENLNLIVDEFGNKWMDSKSPLDRWKAAFWEYSEATNYLNSIYIDYRGLIEKGLAIEVTEKNNPYKK